MNVANDANIVNNPTIEEEEDDEKWRNSKAKQMLKEDIIFGAVTKAMLPRQVFEMRPEYKKFEYKNFVTNLRNLRIAVDKLYARMQADCIAYGHDCAVLKDLRANDPPGPVPWHKSPARKLLKNDIDNNLHKQMQPKELHALRAEYKAFKLKVFRNHIYQEVDKRAKFEHRMKKKKLRPKPLRPTECQAED